MRIGLYGMPCSGKTFILDTIDFIDVIVGSRLLCEYDPCFHQKDKEGRERTRKCVAKKMLEKKDFIMDGHYAFGDEIAFTDEEGEMYEVYLYLYIDPKILRKRMEKSDKNHKFLQFDLEAWQKSEIKSLQSYCFKHNKDFYVIDNPPTYISADASEVLEFIRMIHSGWSQIQYAKKCVEKILNQTRGNSINVFDGDKTLTAVDTANAAFTYTTSIFDGNFYTGWQFWRQSKIFSSFSMQDSLPEFPMNRHICQEITKDSYIISSGFPEIWKKIAAQLKMTLFSDSRVSAQTKYFIVKLCKEADLYVKAWGDSLNDYYMLMEADEGYLVRRSDGSVSTSLSNVNIRSLKLV